MDQNNKLTEQEYEEFAELHNQLNVVKNQLGDLYIQKKKIETKEVELLKSYETIESLLIEMEDKLIFKYGNVSINLKTGESFIAKI
jgi:hypothetical protein